MQLSIKAFWLPILYWSLFLIIVLLSCRFSFTWWVVLRWLPSLYILFVVPSFRILCLSLCRSMYVSLSTIRILDTPRLYSRVVPCRIFVFETTVLKLLLQVPGSRDGCKADKWVRPSCNISHLGPIRLSSFDTGGSHGNTHCGIGFYHDLGVTFWKPLFWLVVLRCTFHLSYFIDRLGIGGATVLWVWLACKSASAIECWHNAEIIATLPAFRTLHYVITPCWWCASKKHLFWALRLLLHSRIISICSLAIMTGCSLSGASPCRSLPSLLSQLLYAWLVLVLILLSTVLIRLVSVILICWCRFR